MRPLSLLALLAALFTSSIPIASFGTTPITVLRLIHDRDKEGGFDLSGDGIVDENDFFLLSLGWDPQDPGIFAPAPSPGGVPERTNQLVITVSGTGEPFTFVELVNGLDSTTASVNGDGMFSVEVSLNPNSLNRIFVSSVDYTGQRGTANPIEIIHDSQPPELHIDFPPDDAELTNDTVMIAGRVGDRLTGFMGLVVEVNGEPAQVDVGIGPNGTFERSGVPLAMGENVIEVIATDELGNNVTKQITLNKVPMTGPQMMAVSGDLQSGMIYSELPQPLVVKMTEADGVTPFPNKIVNFKVIRSDGRLTAAPGLPPASGSMLLQVRTDEQGMAQAYWRMGGDAGCGNNRIAVTSQSISGTVFFCASATPAPPSQINIGSGDNQRTETGGSPPEPLIAWVNDSCNGIEGIPVTFTVVQGDGSVNGESQVTVDTGQTGHAQVQFKAGASPGNHVVEADFLGNPGVPATFTLFAVERNEELPTMFSGQIFDNAYCPLGNARCFLQVAGQTFMAFSNDQGEFLFEDVVDGPGFLHVDATTIDSRNGDPLPPGISFPDLSYDTVLIPNASNALSTPVLLPPLDATNSVSFDNTEDVVLTIDGIEGLELTVKAGSMRRRDGSAPSPANPAILSLNQVHHDDIPMPMPDGVSPPIAWTLQPSGATFDPPIEVRYPNMSGLPAGAIAYFLSFDHDTSEFEVVASGAVSDDGSVIVSDPGAGIGEAGWACNCPPYSVTGSCRNCLDIAVAILDGRPVCPTAFQGFCPEEWSDSSFSAPLRGLAFAARGLNPARVAARVFPPNNSAENQLTLVKRWLDNLSDDGGSHTAGQLCAQSTLILVGHSLGGDTVRLAEELEPDVRIVADPVSRDTLFNGFPGVPFYQRNLSFSPAGEGAVVNFLSEDDLTPEEIQNCSNIGFGNFSDVPCVRGYRITGAEEITVSGADHASIIESSQFQNRVLQAVQDALDGTLKGPDGLVLDSSFMFIVNGQRYQVEDDGSYVIQNISAPDEFGPGGPGSDPDFVADDRTQIVGVGEQDGERVYLLSESFRVLQNGTIIIEDLELHEDPPPLPERLTLNAPSVVLSPGETTQFSLTGLFFDGSMPDLTPTSTGTTYRVSSLDVIDVDDNGQVNAVDNGIAFLTATNFGVTSVKRLTIASQTVSTTVEGFVVDENGDPLTGAEVTTTAFGGTATSDTEGFFSFGLQLPGTTQFVTVVVTAGELEFSSELLPVMVNGITDAGILGPGPQSFLTTVQGVVQFEDTNPAENAVVFTNFGGQGLTGSDGSFSFEVSAELGKGLPTLTVTARLAANGMNFAGNVMDIPIVNGGVTNAGTITLRAISLSPYPGQRFQVADNVERFVTVDIDGDEHVDIASVGLNGEIRIDFGMGDGTFGDEPVLLSNEGFLRDIAVGQLNDDSLSDLAVVDYQDNEVLIFLGNAEGSYQEPLSFPVGEAPGSVVIGNLNGDANPDLAIGSVNSSEIDLLSGNGDGTFDPLDSLDLGGFFNIIRIVIQDINDDTNPDIVASHLGNGNVTVFTGDGQGNFTNTGSNDTGFSTTGVIVADMNEDEIQDLVVCAGQSNGEVSVLIGNGTGTYQERMVTNVGMQLNDIVQGDFDDDDHVDVAVLDRMDNESGVYVLNGVGDGTFEEPVFLPISRFTNTIEAADLDEDGSLDILASLHNQDFGEILYFQNDGAGDFPAQDRIPLVDGIGLRGLEYIDMTSDGLPDLVSLIFLDPAIAVFPASGEGKFGSPILSPTFPNPEGLAFAHLNNDTFLDVATVHRRRPGSQVSLGISLGNGDGTFQESMGSEINANPLRLSVGDIDRDGAADLILPGTTSGVLVLFGFGDGTFSDPVFQSVPRTPSNAELAYLDDDQNLDLIVNASVSGEAISVLLGNGDGSFQQTREFTVHENPDDVLVTLLDGDSFPDIVVGHFQTGEVSVLLGNGDGTFQQQIFADLNIFGGIGESAEFLRAADVNGDSVMDVVFSFVFNSIGVLFGDGSGFLGDFARFDIGNVPLGLIADDLNGDGLPDVVTVNNNGRDLSVLIHN